MNENTPIRISAEAIDSISDRKLCNKYRNPISAYLQHCTPLGANVDRSWNVYDIEEIRPLIAAFLHLFSPPCKQTYFS